jgi:hypothetical protein
LEGLQSLPHYWGHYHNWWIPELGSDQDFSLALPEVQCLSLQAWLLLNSGSLGGATGGQGKGLWGLHDPAGRDSLVCPVAATQLQLQEADGEQAGPL